MKKFRIGIIGVGFGQQVHVPAFRADHRCQVLSICASSQGRAEEVARRLTIDQAVGDWRELVADPQIEAVSLAVPPYLQPEMAMAALGQGKAVFCEKPLAASLSAAQEMVDAIPAGGAPNMVNFEFLEIPHWRRAKNLLDQGRLGRLRHIAISWQVETYSVSKNLPTWKTRREYGGGALYGFGSHVFYYLEKLAGPVKEVGARLFSSLGKPGEQDTLAVINLELESGVPVAITVSSHAFLGSGHRVEFYGDLGALVLENRSRDYVRGFQLWYGGRDESPLQPVSVEEELDPGHPDGRVAAMTGLVRKFVDWLETGVPAGPSLQDGLRVQQLLEVAERSHHLGKWLPVEATLPS